jgi:hypothetical protein
MYVCISMQLVSGICDRSTEALKVASIPWSSRTCLGCVAAGGWQPGHQLLHASRRQGTPRCQQLLHKG